MQVFEYTLDDQPIILSKCEDVSLTAVGSRKGLCLVDSWLLYSVRYTCQKLAT